MRLLTIFCFLGLFSRNAANLCLAAPAKTSAALAQVEQRVSNEYPSLFELYKQ